MILAGDIGGTHTRLALFEEGTTSAPARSETFSSREHGSLAAVVRPFLVVLDERAPLLGAARYALVEMAG